MAAQYRLETLLGLRRRAEDKAKAELAQAQKALAQATALLERLREDLAERKRQRKRKVEEHLGTLLSKGMAALAVQGMGTYEGRLRGEEDEVARQIETQEAVVQEAQALAERKRETLAKAARDVQAIEKHKEKFLKQKKAERESREDLAGEEIGTAQFAARQRK